MDHGRLGSFEEHSRDNPVTCGPSFSATHSRSSNSRTVGNERVVQDASIDLAAVSNSDGPEFADTVGHAPRAGQKKRKHASTSVSRTAISYPRKRAVKACQLCRVRKTKCNNVRPSCGSCDHVGALCLYDDAQDHSSFDPASLIMLDRLDQIIGTLNTYVVPKTSAGLSIHQEPQRSGETENSPTNSILQSGTFQSDQSASATAAQVSTNQTLTPQVSTPQANNSALDETSWEYLQIPACRTSVDTILQWPIFDEEFTTNCLTETLVLGETSEPAGKGVETRNGRRTSGLPARTSGPCIQEEEIEGLVEEFLVYVHIKNPVLDPDSLRSYARKVAEYGPQWEERSCLVYLACALGCLAQPFQLDKMEISPGAYNEEDTSISRDARRLQRAESYYTLARKRIGLLAPSIPAAQCFFFSGVYQMYAIRPLQAWHNFYQASTLCHMCLRFNSRTAEDPTTEHSLSLSRRRSEQRLYWSCFKSECEVRVEIALPVSALGDIDYPYLFPSPPDPSSPICELTPISGGYLYDSSFPILSIPASRRQGSSVVHNQDQSWYYYLAEIALRRIANRVLNAFYKHDFQSWFTMHIPVMIKIAEDFESQLTTWSDGSPAALQYVHRDLRLPEELPYVIRARVIEIQSWLCRPFLFYAIHHSPGNPADARIQSYVLRALRYSIQTIASVSHRHRHHGTWYALRNSTSAAFLLIAAVKCGHISVPAEWEGSVRTQISTLKYWELQSHDIKKARAILLDMLER